MNKHLLATLVLLIAVSGTAQAVQDTELFDWTISLIKATDIENLCTGTSCAPGEKNLLADQTSIVLEITRSFGVWSNK